MTFESLANETDPLVVKRGLLRTLDQLYDDCTNRVRMNRAGVSYPDPDSNGAAKATDLAARILGAIGVDPTVLIQFKNDTAKLVERASTVLRERESAGVLTVGSDDEPD
jgi:hypothetical protein